MPFQSEKQRKYLWANEPKIARDWTDKYGSRVKKQDGGNTWFGGDPRAFFNKHAPYTMNLVGKTPVEKWINQPELIDLETRYGLGSAGLPSIARHTAGMSNLSDTFARALAFNKNNPGDISQFFGDVGAFGAGALNEIPGTWRGLTGSAKDRAETWEDIKANALGTFKTPYGKTSEDIYKDVYAGKYADLFNNQKGTIVPDKGIMKTNVLSNILNAFKNEFGGSAQAAGMPINNNQTILPKARPTMANWSQFDDLEAQPSGMFEEEDEQSGLWELLKRAGRFITPGGKFNKMGLFPRGGINFNFKGSNAYRPATGSAGGYNAAQLNKMNALGGYYTEPARQQRRDRVSATKLLSRKAAAEAGQGGWTTAAQKNLNQKTMGSRPGHYDRPGGDGGNQGGSGQAAAGTGASGPPGRNYNMGGLASLWQR